MLAASTSHICAPPCPPMPPLSLSQPFPLPHAESGAMTMAHDPCHEAELAVLRHPYLSSHLAAAVVPLAATCISESLWYRAHIQALERSARGAEGECEAAVKRRVDIAVQQVAVWQAAAEATVQLQDAQEQKAAKAARHSQKVTT